jgi:hypothetical protein
MKTLLTTDKPNVIISKSNRTMLTGAGLVTAFLCTMALWYDANASDHIDTTARRLLVLETPKTITPL